MEEGNVVDEALEAEVDRARAVRRWEAVVTLATELAARAAERRVRAEREVAGVVDLRSRRRR